MAKKIICFGDSLTTCGGPQGRYSDLLATCFPQFEVINAGKGGEKWPDALVRMDGDVLSQKPDIVLLEYGANDWWKALRPPEEWAADLETCIVKIQEAGAKVVVLGVFGLYRDCHTFGWLEKSYGADERSRQYRALEEEIARRHGCPYLPNIQSDIIADRSCWRDRNHPNEHGNRQVAAQIVPVIEAMTGVEANKERLKPLRTLLDIWEEAVKQAPDAPAVICDDRVMTFKEADRDCIRLAGSIGCCKENSLRVAVCAPNGLEYFLIYWAVVRMGGVIVPLNPWLKTESYDAILDTVKPDFLFIQDKSNTELLDSIKGHKGFRLCFLDKISASNDELAFDELLSHKGPSPFGETVHAPKPDDPAIIMHTSGTTSAPKGAVMRHSDLIFNVMTTINAQGFVPADRHLLVNPMFHCTALYSQLPLAAYHKAPVIITAETQPDRLLELMEKEKVTTCMTVPSILQRITAYPEVRNFNLSCLRVIGYAGSFMPVKTVRQLQALFPNVQLHNFFGLTETISATHAMSGEDALERPDSIGKPLPFVYPRITAENGRECAPGEIGELLFARENVIPEYWNKPGKLEESLVELDGRTWFRTGDLAMRDEEGYYFIKGRKKDMIIVGGENVFASEVESALMQLEGVREAAVIGIPATGVRESLGEMIKAFVVLEPDAKLTEMEIRKHCRKNLPSYKIPHVMVFMDALPRNPSGKVVKGELPR